jgi:two-component system OmpR family sensor kinase
MSLRTRLLLGVGLVLLLALAAADLTVRAELQRSLYQHIASTLTTSQRSVRQLLAPPTRADSPGDRDRAGAADHDTRQDQAPTSAGTDSGPPSITTPSGAVDTHALCNFIDVNLAASTFVDVRAARGTTVGGQTCAAYISGVAYRPALPAHISGLGTAAGSRATTRFFNAPSTQPGGPTFRVAASRLRPGTSGDVLVVAMPLTSVERTLEQLDSIELVVSVIALVLGILIGWLLIHIDLRPLRDIEHTAGEIASGELTSRVPGAHKRTEVGHVAAALNFMLGRIEEAFAARDHTEAELRASEDRLRRFVGDASHELRTPIAAVSAYAELFGHSAALRPADLERAMTGIQRETTRMSHLVEDLLLLARLDEGRPLERQRLELVGLAIEAVQTARAVGPQWPVRVQATGPVEVVGDPLRLRQVIDNLLANVRAHTPPGTEASVRVSEDGGMALIDVSDNGPGMPAEHAAKIFDRFYRADPSRARSRGGAGLGLSIVASIVALHGGSVSVESHPGEGTTFHVRLAAEPPERDEPEEPRIGDVDERDELSRAARN